MKIIIILTLVISLLVLSSCDMIEPYIGGDGEDPGGDIPLDNLKKYRVGYEGLDTSFEEKQMPDEVYQNTPFQVIFLVHNKGASTVQGKILLTLDEKYLEFSSWDLPSSASAVSGANRIVFNLEGKSIYLPKGEKEVFWANLNTKSIGRQMEEDITSYSLTTCYEYKTYADIDVCIDTTDPYSTRTTSCEAEDVTLNGGQGAPVTVELVEVTTRPDPNNKNRAIPEFKIHIQNRGYGDVVNKAYVAALCGEGTLPDAVSYKEGLFNRVEIQAKLSGEKLTCTKYGKEYATLENDKGDITCVLNSGINKEYSSYMSPLNIELSYGYTDIISNEIIIKR